MVSHRVITLDGADPEDMDLLGATQPIAKEIRKPTRSEQARHTLAPVVSRICGAAAVAGEEVEWLFRRFWALARAAAGAERNAGDGADGTWLPVVAQTFDLCAELQALAPVHMSPAAWKRVTHRLLQLMARSARAEVRDLEVLGQRSVSEIDYVQMVLHKTAPWFTGRILCAVAATEFYDHELSRELEEFGNMVAIAYQIRADVLDVRTRGNDIATGKLSYPMLALVQLEPSFLFCQPFEAAEQIMMDYKILERAEQRAAAYEEKARALACRLDPELADLAGELAAADVT